MTAAKPNQVRNHLKIVARLCDDKLTGDPAHPHRRGDFPVFDSANLDRAVEKAADLLDEIDAGDQARRLREMWNNVSLWEDEIESLAFAREETTQALNSWRESIRELSGLALEMANSSEVGEANGRIFSENGNREVAAISNEPLLDRKRKPGRPSDTDHVKDGEIWEKWRSKQFVAKAELAKDMGIPARDVVRAIDRVRKREERAAD